MLRWHVCVWWPPKQSVYFLYSGLSQIRVQCLRTEPDNTERISHYSKKCKKSPEPCSVTSQPLHISWFSSNSDFILPQLWRYSSDFLIVFLNVMTLFLKRLHSHCSWSLTLICVLQKLSPKLMNCAVQPNVTRVQSECTLSVFVRRHRSVVAYMQVVEARLFFSLSCVIAAGGFQCLCAFGFKGNGTFCQGNIDVMTLQVDQNHLRSAHWSVYFINSDLLMMMMMKMVLCIQL